MRAKVVVGAAIVMGASMGDKGDDNVFEDEEPS